MMAKFCPNCSAKVAPNENFCQYCGAHLDITASRPSKQRTGQFSPADVVEGTSGSSEYVGMPKYRVVAALLAFAFGTFAVHKFYLNQTGKAIVRLVFFWTGVPTVLGLIEGLLYLTDSNDTFAQRISAQGHAFPKQPERDKWFAGVLAIVFGFCGAHHCFLRDSKAIWYAIFSITGIPWLMSIVESLIFFFEPVENFKQRYGY